MLKHPDTSMLLASINLNILNMFSSKHVSILDQHGWPIYVSDSSLKLLKTTRDEFWDTINSTKQNNPELSFEEIMCHDMPGEEKQAIQARLSAQKNLNTPYSWTAKIKTKNEKILWLSGETVGLLHPMDENQIITVSLIEDISEPLKIKEQLLQQQRLLEVTANNTPAMIYQFTIDKNQQWKWLYISEGVRKIMGVSPEDLYENPQKGIQDVHPDDLPSVFINLEKACKTGTPFSWYGRLQRPGQPIKWLHCQTSKPVYLNDELKTILLSGVFIDVTPLKKLETVQQDLIESEALLKLVSQKAPAMIYQFSIDKHGEWSWPFVSEGSKKLINISHQELLQDPYCIIKIIHPEDVAQIEIGINQSKESMKQFSWTGRMTPKGQETIWVHAQSNPKKKDDGSITWLGVFVDITPIKDLEIAENKLLLANKEKDDAIEDIVLKNKFIGELSHELRTPLISINGFSELLLENVAGPLNTKQTQYVQSVRTSGAHLLDLINKVLDISKTLQEQSSIKPQITDIGLFIKNFLDAIEPLRTQNNHSIKLNISSEIPSLMIDQMKFKQVLYNIVHNAIKYSSERTTIIIATLIKDNNLFIKITDQGFGLTQKQRKMLFRSFSTPHANQILISKNKTKIEHPTTDFLQTSTNTKEKTMPNSTGLGLYLTKILMEAMGGEIELYSDGRNKGTTVTLTFNDVVIADQEITNE